MMHPHFWEIAEYAAEKNFALSLITNGLLIDEKGADRLAALNFHQVTLSLYSTDGEVHDGMTRRRGSHAMTCAAIERLRARGVAVGINCLLTRANIDRCFDLERWAHGRGILIQFDAMVTARSDASLAPTMTRATGEQLLRYYRALKAKGRGPAPQPVGEANDPVCNAGRGKCAVNPHGDLLTCLEVREAIGNLKEQSFRALWSSEKAKSLRGYRNRDLKFNGSCGDGAFCDHCPGMAGMETGDRMSPVPFLMELAAIKRRVFQESD
jgi:radical SAM protein with 4Fe4S-binding SPASM domain